MGTSGFIRIRSTVFIYLSILFPGHDYCVGWSVGMLSATASLGLLFLWDVDGGLTQIDKYTHSTDEYIKSGAFLACGIVNARIRNECDPAKALLAEHVLSKSNIIRTGAIIGLVLYHSSTWWACSGRRLRGGKSIQRSHS